MNADDFRDHHEFDIWSFHRFTYRNLVTTFTSSRFFLPLSMNIEYSAYHKRVCIDLIYNWTTSNSQANNFLQTYDYPG